MSRRPLLRASALGAISVLAAIAVTGCASSTSKETAGAKTVKVALTKTGCSPDASSVAAGPVTFDVSNAGTGAVTEAELQQTDSTILAEKENVAPGLSGSFSVSLKPGKYKLYCPGGSTDGYTDFTVTGTSEASTLPAAATAALTKGQDDYATYIRQQVAELVSTTKTFTDAVRAGDLAAAEAAYPAPRVRYERVEPVAEAFTSSTTGNLDAAIDERVDDVTEGQEWTGFHRIEQAMYVKKSLAGLTPIANQLDKSVTELQTLVATKTYQPGTIASGAVELLDEVGATKITGEEERYSHIDLVDLVANVSGSEQAFSDLKPALTIVDPTLATQVSTRFATLDKALAAYSTGSGPTDYKSFATVSQADRKMIGQLVDAVAEPLAQVGGKVVGA